MFDFQDYGRKGSHEISLLQNERVLVDGIQKQRTMHCSRGFDKKN